jgi:2-amino-4-hydroxy-6-hydroxymethyldihydropteridine diphosphokinase
MNIVYLLLGSNLNDRFQNLHQALESIQLNCGCLLKKSSIYETAAWGNTNQPNFLNQVIILQTQHDPQLLLQELLHIEKQMGRIRVEKYDPRIIDLDILFYNREIINEPYLNIPHPHIAERRFVLTPLVEIVPNKMHPVLNLTMKTLLNECIDNLNVQLINPVFSRN